MHGRQRVGNNNNNKKRFIVTHDDNQHEIEALVHTRNENRQNKHTVDILRREMLAA